MYEGRNPNGINQISQSLLSIDVAGDREILISTSSVEITSTLKVNGPISASMYSGSGKGLFDIPTTALTGDISRIARGNATASVQQNKFSVNVNTDITGSLRVTGEVSASFLKGDGSGIFNIPASALGDLDRIKSGSAEAVISPNKGLIVSTDLTTTKNLRVPKLRRVQQICILRSNWWLPAIRPEAFWPNVIRPVLSRLAQLSKLTYPLRL